jgi:hypothetical protein
MPIVRRDLGREVALEKPVLEGDEKWLEKEEIFELSVALSLFAGA